jgi:hypothetical protein
MIEAIDLIEKRILDYDTQTKSKMKKKSCNIRRRELKCSFKDCPVLYTLSSVGKFSKRGGIPIPESKI